MLGKQAEAVAAARPATDFGRFLQDERGATAIEYGLIVGLIFLAVVGAVRQYADNTGSMYSKISSAVSD